jgi:hypothetical protein
MSGCSGFFEPQLLPSVRFDLSISVEWLTLPGDSLRFGFNSIWLTDYRRGLLWRIPYDAEPCP